MIAINQNYFQRKYKDMFGFNPTIQPRSIDWYNDNIIAISTYKNYVSDIVFYYLNHLKDFNVKLDINRKCRALGIPAWYSCVNIDSQGLVYFCNIIKNKLLKYVNNKNDLSQKACNNDISEIFTYARMCQEIMIMTKSKICDFPDVDGYGGNPFEYILHLISLYNSIITRFKYVKIGNSKPVEKLITYHLWTNKRLLIHVEGDVNFIGWKYWGSGDQTIKNFKNDDIIIRWGIDDFNKNKKFLY